VRKESSSSAAAERKNVAKKSDARKSGVTERKSIVAGRKSVVGESKSVVSKKRKRRGAAPRYGGKGLRGRSGTCNSCQWSSVVAWKRSSVAGERRHVAMAVQGGKGAEIGIDRR
jgi:hypothetical protein